MKTDTFGFMCRHSLFRVVTCKLKFLVFPSQRSVFRARQQRAWVHTSTRPVHAHQTHAHRTCMANCYGWTQAREWHFCRHKIAHVNISHSNGFMLSCSTRFRVCWQISYPGTHMLHTLTWVSPGLLTSGTHLRRLLSNLLASTIWSLQEGYMSILV